MAKHRKPRGATRWSRLPLRSLTTALSLAGVASAAGLLDGVAVADAEPTPPEIREPADRRHRQAEDVTGRENAAAEAGLGAQAAAFAFAQLGKACAWGSTGPDAYDCSGLVQAAWHAAGVALPRTSYRQADAGSPVPLGELSPGDLVFYHSGSSHVGIYVGEGQIIHASRPGVPVALAPVDSLPITAVTRPA